MNELRAKPGDLCIADAMPFNQHHEYRTMYPISDIVHGRFFLPLRSQLYPGDSITICRFDKLDASRRDARLMEVATVRIVASGPNVTEVPLLPVGDIVKVGGIAGLEHLVGETVDLLASAHEVTLDQMALAQASVDPPKRGPGRPPKQQAEAA